MMMLWNSNGIYYIYISNVCDLLTTFSFLLFCFRSTLTDSAFVKTLCDNDIIVWGGDVRDQEAWSGK